MKEFTVYDTATGKILRAGHCQASALQYQAQAGESVIEGLFDHSGSYISHSPDPDKPENQLVEVTTKPARPGINYDWDYQNKLWVGNLQAARTLIKLKIEELRAQKDNAVIVYDNKNVDADQTAKDAIITKIAELQARDAASQPEPAHIWRDADNVTHTFLTLIGYKLWLNRLMIAISTRSTGLRVVAWAHKDAILALTTVAAIESYDYTTGW